MAYRDTMLKNVDSLDGCAGLKNVDSFAQWMEFEGRLRAQYQDSYVPSDEYGPKNDRDRYFSDKLSVKGSNKFSNITCSPIYDCFRLYFDITESKGISK